MQDDRLVILAHRWTPFAAPLTEAALSAAVPGVRVAAVWDTADPALGWRRSVRAKVLRRCGVPGVADPGALRRIAMRHGVPFLRVPAGDVNHPGWMPALLALRPTLLLAFGCLQILGQPLLDAVDMAVNYHNGLLPGRRGLRASAWSIYEGDARSGWSFHRMTAAIDEGPVLLDGAIPVGPGDTGGVLDAAKTRQAAQGIAEVLAQMRRRAPGRPQAGPACYRGRVDTRRVCRVDDPSAITWDDLQRRLRAFGCVRVRVAGRLWPVTAVARAGAGERCAFRTADGTRARLAAVWHLPPFLFRYTMGWFV